MCKKVHFLVLWAIHLAKPKMGKSGLQKRAFSKVLRLVLFIKKKIGDFQFWTEGRSSMAVAKDLRPTTTATVAKV